LSKELIKKLIEIGFFMEENQLFEIRAFRVRDQITIWGEYHNKSKPTVVIDVREGKLVEKK